MFPGAWADWLEQSAYAVNKRHCIFFLTDLTPECVVNIKATTHLNRRHQRYAIHYNQGCLLIQCLVLRHLFLTISWELNQGNRKIGFQMNVALSDANMSVMWPIVWHCPCSRQQKHHLIQLLFIRLSCICGIQIWHHLRSIRTSFSQTVNLYFSIDPSYNAVLLAIQQVGFHLQGF